MLIEWIAAYEERNDTLSHQAHKNLLEQFDGRKIRVTKNGANPAFVDSVIRT